MHKFCTNPQYSKESIIKNVRVGLTADTKPVEPVEVKTGGSPCFSEKTGGIYSTGSTGSGGQNDTLVHRNTKLSST